MRVKFDTLGSSDFVQLHLNDVGGDDSGDIVQRFDDMLSTGASYPLDFEGTSREGLFDDEMVYLVYEKQDLEALRGVIDRAIALE